MPRKRRQKQDEEAAPATSAAPALEPAKMTVATLRAALEERGEETKGKKAELVARLQAAIKADGDQPSAKKVKKEEEDDEVCGLGFEESDFSKAVRALKSAPAAAGGKKKKRTPKVDPQCYGTFSVVDDWDCMLNQTNIGQNNNKFYVIQLLRNAMGRWTLWTRWGRVGETGQTSRKQFSDIEEAKKEFCKKFRDKTKNSWEKRDEFVPAKGKYTLLEMDDDDDEGGDEEMREKLAALDETDAPPRLVRECSLDKPTQNLIKLLFDHDMFSDAMKSMEIDTKKMPLGKLSRTQIAKGFEALEAVEDALNKSAPRSKLAELSSKFYTIIPHSFGRATPPAIVNHDMLQKKFDMLLVLGDIEIAQGIEKKQDIKQEMDEGEVLHPLDINYENLKAKLETVKKEEEDYDIITKYMQATLPMWRRMEIQDVWKVDREGEGKRFNAHGDLDNRKLLWHGTNVAVVAAILKSGLRIMPHSGGRVGKGIYFASECSKSAGYVRCAGTTGIMFLSEVALGKEKLIERDDWTLTQPPPGCDSIVAKGRTEPDPTKDVTIEIESNKVTVPQGAPLTQPRFTSSNFSQSEYLVYKESQARLRYLLRIKM